MDKMVFLNVGWMGKYNGLDGDKIKGGGSHVQDHGYGHEIFNFRSIHGTLYGYAPCRSIDVKRLGASPSVDYVTGVLVLWVATKPRQGGRYIVGWYDNATVHSREIVPNWAADRLIDRHSVPGIPIKPEDIDKHAVYLVEADKDNCLLLPIAERTFEIPRRGIGNMGQRAVWYADHLSKRDFRRRVIDYVRTMNEAVSARRKKYRGGAEGPDHRLLKEWCAHNPQQLGLSDVTSIPGRMEHPACDCLQDRADVIFDMPGGRYAVIEVETNDPQPGAYQALKYKTLLCAQQGYPVDSDKVEAILVAWEVPADVRTFCEKYGVTCFAKRL